jgi:hypothetical protein
MNEPRQVDLRPFLTDAAVASWEGVHALAETLGTEHWAITGGQMVMIHLAPHRDTGHRTTADADIVVDVRAGKLAAMAEIAGLLKEQGFKPELSPEGITKFTRGAARIDLLAPEGMGNDVPTVDGGRAIAAPGATQALQRTEMVAVTWSDQTTVLRCPTLFSAIVAKAAAATGTNEGASRRQRHLDDVVALASVMAVVGPGDEKPTNKDRKRIRSAVALLTQDNPAWLATSEPQAAAAILAELTQE